MRILERARPEAGGLPGHGLVPLRQHHPVRRGAGLPRRRVPRAADPGLHPLERRGHGGPGQCPLGGHRRPPVHLRQLRLPLRGGVQPLLPGQGRRRTRGPGLLPGPRLPRHLRPGLRRGPPLRGAARQLPVRGGDQRALLVSPPAAHARILGVPDGVDGPRPAQRHRPGPRQPLPPRPGHGRHRRQPGVVLRRGRRVRRARDDRRPRDGRPGAPRQPGVRGQLQPPAARRPGAGQRQGHPGVRGPVPGGGLERDQGDLGTDLGRPAGQGRRGGAARQDELDRRRRVPEVRHRVGRLHPGALLRPRPPAAGAGQPSLATRSCSRFPAAATTTASSTPPTRRPPSTSGLPPPSWPRPSRAGPSDPRSRPATPPTRSRR